MFRLKIVNKLFFTVLILSLFVPVLHLSAKSPKIKFSSLTFAIHRADNDISLEDKLSGNRVVIPLCVKHHIEQLVNEFVEGELSDSNTTPEDKVDWKERKESGEVYGPTYFIKTPASLGLFVFKFNWSISICQYYLILYDPRANKCSEVPLELSGRWLTGVDSFKILTKPFVGFEDIGGSGQKDLVLQDIEHNGTDSTADVYLYYLMGKDLSFKTDLAIQTKADAPGGNQTNRKIIERKRNYLKIGVFDPKPIGSFEVIKSSPDQPYQLLKVTINPKYHDKNEDLKLEEGFMLSNQAGETGNDLSRLVTEGY